MSVFLEFEPIQVQSYISRWADLKGRRGASALSRDATVEGGALYEMLSTDFGSEVVENNRHAVSTDGSVHLTVFDENRLDAIEQRVFDYLAAKVPGARYQVVRFGDENTGEPSEINYWTARPTSPQSQIHHGRQVVTLPALAEIPTLARCGLTGADTAIGNTNVSDETFYRAGGDAYARVFQADWRNRKALTAFGALESEVRLGEALGFDPTVPKGEKKLPWMVDDFEALAELGPADRKRNHLATIAIDGDQIGLLMEQAGHTDRLSLSKCLKQATWGALTEGSRAVLDQTQTGPNPPDQPGAFPVLPHIVGGDDVVLTVPAGYALLFVRTYFETFLASTSEKSISASAGVVIHKTRFPFNRAIKLADTALAIAKTKSRTEPTATVQELTTSSATIDRNNCWTVAELDRQRPYLEKLASMDKSTRAALQRAADIALKSDDGLDHSMLAKAGIKIVLRRKGCDMESVPLDDDALSPEAIARALMVTRWWS